MGKMLIAGLATLALGVSAAAFAWRVYAPASPGDTVPAQVADAPSSKGIFPKVLNH
jgi:hypothetical protein